MYELDVARYGKWPSSNVGGLSKMACQGVRNRPDKFFKRPDLFSSHDLNPPIYTVLVVVPFLCQGDVGLGSQRGRPYTAKLTSDLREVKP
jgi:hypothetical protein